MRRCRLEAVAPLLVDEIANNFCRKKIDGNGGTPPPPPPPALALAAVFVGAIVVWLASARPCCRHRCTGAAVADVLVLPASAEEKEGEGMIFIYLS